MKAQNPSTSGAGKTSAETLSLVRRHVRDLLERSPAFRALPPGRQRRLADDMVKVAGALAEPAGIRTDRLGAASGDFVSEVDFPAFVGELIGSVFEAVVDASIQQMEAYGELVAGVAETVDRFADENVSAGQGRDWLVSAHPDLFVLDEGSGCERPPCVRLRDGVDPKRALARVGRLPLEGGPPSGLDDRAIEEKLVPAARRVAAARRRLLATMVLMGVNRIVVTGGTISARLEFAARS